jgi:hypothetical protein
MRFTPAAGASVYDVVELDDPLQFTAAQSAPLFDGAVTLDDVLDVLRAEPAPQEQPVAGGAVTVHYH